jgi:hypothetical protein
MPRLPLLALLLALIALALGVGSGFADEPAPGVPPGAGKGGKDAEPDDGADDKIPFADEINRALAQGVLWLKAKPKTFMVGDGTAAHWGLVRADEAYGGGEGGKGSHPAGPTALALYTLLKCGVDPKDPVIVQGFHWLRVSHQPTEEWDGQAVESGYQWTHTMAGSSYEVSAMILALTAKYDQFKRNKNTAEKAKKGKLKITDPADMAWLQELVDGLVERRGANGSEAEGPEGRLGWRYNFPKFTLSSGRGTLTHPGAPAPPHANQDLSSTQLAVLALYSAHRFGAKAPPEIWRDVVKFTLAHQEESGPERQRHVPGYREGNGPPPVDHARGFCYIPGSPDRTEGKATGAMTGCGLANLLIAREVLRETDKGRRELLEKLDEPIATAVNDGLAWLDLHWSAFQNPSGGGHHIYYLYCVERAMDILGKNLIGTHPWYTEGARKILDNAKQAKVQEALKKGTREVDGMYWETGATHEPKDVLDTCFALLFLKRATKDLVPPPAVTGGSGAPSENR